ncbi:MAG: diaminopimelate epimerase [Dehalococcoidales bacterium]|nr:diaminopimelate epimerase [Dehalococcoidales bacterium]
MKFTKMQGAGNDYVVIESNGAVHDWSKLAIEALNRHFGIGADSLLLVMPSNTADFQMRIFDTDGSEAEACGNGIRCLTRYVYERGLVKGGAKSISVETQSGVREIKLNIKSDKLVGIQANMGRPRFAAEEIPVSGLNGHKITTAGALLNYEVNVGGTDVILSLVSMGNPHAVFFQQKPVAEFPLGKLGPMIENLSIFPNRVNFEVARVVNRKLVEARVWERGVGETLACGSGACAIIAAGQSLGQLDPKIEVKLPGGVLGVEWDGKGDVLLSGPAEIVFTGEWTGKE